MVTTMAQVADKTEAVLCKLHTTAREVLQRDEKDKSGLPSVRQNRVIEDKQFLTVLNRAIDGCIKWKT